MKDTYIALSRAVSYFHRWLSPPIFENEDKTRIASIFNTLILSAVAVLFGLLTAQITLGVENPRNVTVALVTCVLLLGVRQIARRGQISLAILLFCSLWLVGISLIAYNNGTIRAMGIAGLVTCVIVPTLLIGRRLGLIFVGLTVTFVFGLARAEMAGALPSIMPRQLSPTNQWLVFTAIILFHWILVSAARNSMVKALERAREENTARQHAEENLRQLNASLEARVAKRTAELEWEILQHKKTEELLRSSEMKFRLLTENAQDLIYRFRLVPTRGFEYTSQAATRITGYTPEEHYADPDLAFKLVHPDDRHLLDEAARGEIPQDMPLILRWLRKNGSMIWIELRNTPIFDDHGNLVAIEGIARDITERKQVEEALRESEARYRAIFQTSGVSIWEEDFSTVKAALDELRSQGVTDFRQYFEEHPDFVHEAMRLLKVIDVNETTLALYAAKTKAEFLASLDTIFTSETLETFKEELITLAEQKIYFEGEVTDRTLRGDTLHLWRTIVFPKEKASFKSVLVCLTNITEHKRAEEALRESEERLRFVMAATQDAVYDWDIRSGQVFRNEAYQMLFSPNKPVGTDETWWENQMHPDDRQRVMESIRNTFQERKQSWSGEYRFGRSDGTYASVIDRGYIVYDAKGQPKRFIGAIIDFTERKHAEEKLRESEARYRSVIASMAEGVVVQASDGSIIAVNASAERILGLTVDQMLGRTSLDPRWRSIHEDASPFPGETHPGMITLGTGKPQSNVIMGVHKPNGDLTWISINSEPIFGSNQDLPEAVVATFTDITERKRAEEELRRSNERFEKAFRISPSGMVISRYSDGTILEANETFLGIFGYTRQEVLGASSLSLGMFADPENRQRAVQRLREEGTLRDFELEIRRKSGETRQASISATGIDLAGEACLLAIVNDITDIKHAELARARTEAELQASLKRTKVLYDVTSTAVATGSLTTLLQEIAEHVAEGLPANRVSLLTFDLQSQKIKNFVRGGSGADQSSLSVSYNELMEGLSGWAIRTGQSALSPKNFLDPRESAAVQKRRAETNCGSILVSPLQYQEHKLGTLTAINLPEETDFTDNDVELMEAIASQVSSAIVKIALEDNLNRRNERLAFLHQITLNLIKQDNIDDMTQSIADEISQLLHADGGYLALVEGEMLVDRAISPKGSPYKMVTSRLEEDQTIIRQIINSRETLVVKDFSSLPNISAQATALGIKAAILLPLLSTETCQGVLGAGRIRSDEAFSEEDVYLGSLFSRMAGVILDNTRLRETIRQEAIRDPLTGLFNRRFMQEALVRELSRAERHSLPLAVAILDLDHFKRINDTYGHDAGDEALRQLSSLLQSKIRSSDVVCRYGGEEFTLILPEASLIDAYERMQMLGEDVRRMLIHYNGKDLERLTVSIGVSVYPNHGLNIKTLLKAADEALYRAKLAGRDRVTVA